MGRTCLGLHAGRDRGRMRQSNISMATTRVPRTWNPSWRSFGRWYLSTGRCQILRAHPNCARGRPGSLAFLSAQTLIRTADGWRAPPSYQSRASSWGSAMTPKY